MSPDEIHALDGKGLTRLAYELGFGHGGLRRTFDPETLWTHTHALPRSETALWIPWEPHVNLAQARAVFFDGLHALGWNTVHEWRAQERAEGYGHVAAYRQSTDALPGGATVAVEWPLATWPTPAAPTEAQALLLAACLAVASEEA